MALDQKLENYIEALEGEIEPSPKIGKEIANYMFASGYSGPDPSFWAGRPFRPAESIDDALRFNYHKLEYSIYTHADTSRARACVGHPPGRYAYAESHAGPAAALMAAFIKAELQRHKPKTSAE